MSYQTKMWSVVCVFALSLMFMGCQTTNDRPVMTTILSSGKEIRLVSLGIAVSETPGNSVLMVECASQANEDKAALHVELREIIPIAEKTADLWGLKRIDVYPYQSVKGETQSVYRCTKEKDGSWSVKDSLGIDFKLL